MFGLLGEYLAQKERIRNAMGEYERNGWKSPLIECEETRRCRVFGRWKPLLQKAMEAASQRTNRSSRRR